MSCFNTLHETYQTGNSESIENHIYNLTVPVKQENLCEESDEEQLMVTGDDREIADNPMYMNCIKTELDLKDEDSDSKRHFLDDDGSVGDYKCEVCNVHYEEPYLLQLHILNEHREDK